MIRILRTSCGDASNLLVSIVFVVASNLAVASPILHGSNGDALWKIDSATGASTNITSTGSFTASGLAFTAASVPEPAIIFLFGAGIVGLAGTKLTRKRDIQ